jgi:hypothetical protein
MQNLQKSNLGVRGYIPLFQNLDGQADQRYEWACKVTEILKDMKEDFEDLAGDDEEKDNV